MRDLIYARVSHPHRALRNVVEPFLTNPFTLSLKTSTNDLRLPCVNVASIARYWAEGCDPIRQSRINNAKERGINLKYPIESGVSRYDLKEFSWLRRTRLCLLHDETLSSNFRNFDSKAQGPVKSVPA